MNSQPETQSPEQIRSDIETTRQRMDNTMDALGQRLHGRHLVDELIGFFRSSSENPSDPNASSSGSGGDAANQLKEKASSALSAVADTVKNNPVPALVIGAGIAWLIYESRRGNRASNDANERDEDDEHFQDYRQPLEYPAADEEGLGFSGEDDYGPVGNESGSSAESGMQRAKDAAREKAYESRDIVHEKLSRVREGAANLRERVSDLGSRVQERTKEIYTQGRDRVVRTANEQPLAVGLGVLALGVIAGLSLPTPQRVNRIAGPTADRLRQKARETGRDYVERGRRVARAAADAAKSEAEKQGLTLEALRGKTAGAQPQPPGQPEASPQTPDRGSTAQNSPTPGTPPSSAGATASQNAPRPGQPAGDVSAV
jgi:hypothetical protein